MRPLTHCPLRTRHEVREWRVRGQTPSRNVWAPHFGERLPRRWRRAVRNQLLFSRHFPRVLPREPGSLVARMRPSGCVLAVGGALGTVAEFLKQSLSSGC